MDHALGRHGDRELAGGWPASISRSSPGWAWTIQPYPTVPDVTGTRIEEPAVTEDGCEGPGDPLSMELRGS